MPEIRLDDLTPERIFMSPEEKEILLDGYMVGSSLSIYQPLSGCLRSCQNTFHIYILNTCHINQRYLFLNSKVICLAVFAVEVLIFLLIDALDAALCLYKDIQYCM